VVAGDEERPRLRAQLPQRLGVRAELLDRAIHQVADDRHQGRPRVVDLTHDSVTSPPSTSGLRWMSESTAIVKPSNPGSSRSSSTSRRSSRSERACVTP